MRGAGGSQQVFESGGYRRRSRRPSESELESQKAVEFLPPPVVVPIEAAQPTGRWPYGPNIKGLDNLGEQSILGGLQL